MAKSFLTRFSHLAPRSRYRYTQFIKLFMRWYGDNIDDVKVKIPQTLPEYTEDVAIEKLEAAIRGKSSHKGTIERDLLLVLLGYQTGMRRAELAHLKVFDVHDDYLLVRAGKNKKDRMIPLLTETAARLHQFIADKQPEDLVFDLTPESISNKIRIFARKAGLPHFHAHTLRHKFGTDVMERSGDPKAVQVLMGHESLATTNHYIATTDKRLRDAINSLGKSPTQLLKKSSDITSLPGTLPQDHRLIRHLDELTETASRIAHQYQRLLRYLDTEEVETVGDIYSHLFFFRKSNNTIVEESADTTAELTWENEHPIDPYLAGLLRIHYIDIFGNLPFNEWNRVTPVNVSPEIVNNLHLLAHGILKQCVQCPICRALILTLQHKFGE